MTKSTNNDSDTVAESPVSVLIVDNDKHHAQAMAEILERTGYPCKMATSGPEGAKRIDQETYDVVITDLMMNDIDGMDILSRAQESLPDCEVIMVTGHGTIPRAVEAMQQGAFTFIEKPIHADGLRAATDKAAEAIRLRRTNLDLHQRLDEKFGYEQIIYASSQMQNVIDRLKRLSPTDARVLITGENGTGKELVAQAIHQNSPRKKKRFVAVNFAALSEHLLESELFGHIKGAYTDADADRVGRFEYADGGTLFLDEVGDMPMPTQIKLLRVLESGEITRVGENKPFRVNVRVLSATNRNLEDAVKAGTFREDLYFRLKVVTIHLPRLAERRDDIIPLLDRFRKEFCKQHSKSIKSVSPDVTRQLFAYDWPGNIRELRNAVETMVVLDTDGAIDMDDLPPEIADLPAPSIEESGQPHWDLIGKSLADIEKWAIEETLRLTNGNREDAARTLGIGARTLYRKIKEYDLQEKK
ncbi:MAG: sigma-54 dependent transcriptional regulator [Pirellulaceae bacterium]|nr:sigma-54 dependent transcriptional regulator [Pirellulaceae bacterium]